MKYLTMGCYAIVFSALSLSMVLLVKQTSLNVYTPDQFSVSDFGTFARY